MLTHRLGELLDRKGRVAVEGAVAGRVGLVRRSDQLVRIAELGQQAVDGRMLVHPTSSFTSASGSSVRISKMEIIGRTRTNRNSSVTNRPIVPMNVDQSQNVG